MVVAGEHDGASFIPLSQHCVISVPLRMHSECLWLGFLSAHHSWVGGGSQRSSKVYQRAPKLYTTAQA